MFQMNFLLKEYLVSGEVKEAERCLRDLEVPHFHHELVYEVNTTKRFGSSLEGHTIKKCLATEGENVIWQPYTKDVLIREATSCRFQWEASEPSRRDQVSMGFSKSRLLVYQMA